MHGNVRFAGRSRLSNNTPANRHDVENSENFPSYLIILSRTDSLFFGVIFEIAPEAYRCSEKPDSHCYHTQLVEAGLQEASQRASNYLLTCTFVIPS